jgi:hypothetical protein
LLLTRFISKMIFMVPITLIRNFVFSKLFYNKDVIQKCLYEFITLQKVQILFFDLFEMYYASEHHITYPFTSTKHAYPITSRNKTLV